MDSLTLLAASITYMIPAPESQVKEIVSLFKAQRYAKKASVHTPHMTTDNFAFVGKGCLKHFAIEKNGNEQVIGFSKEGDWLGTFGRIPAIRPNYFIHALEPTELLFISSTDAHKLLDSNPIFREFIRLRRQYYIVELETKAAAWQRLSAPDRYNWMMLHEPDIMNRVPRHDLASYLGIQPQSLSRMQKRLLKNKAKSNPKDSKVAA